MIYLKIIMVLMVFLVWFEKFKIINSNEKICFIWGYDIDFVSILFLLFGRVIILFLFGGCLLENWCLIGVFLLIVVK